jgi:hypothetical protein
MAAITATKLVMAFTVTNNQGNWELEIKMMDDTIVIQNNWQTTSFLANL